MESTNLKEMYKETVKVKLSWECKGTPRNEALLRDYGGIMVVNSALFPWEGGWHWGGGSLRFPWVKPLTVENQVRSPVEGQVVKKI